MFEDTALALVGSIGIGTLALLGAASLASILSGSARPQEVRRRDGSGPQRPAR